MSLTASANMFADCLGSPRWQPIFSTHAWQPIFRRQRIQKCAQKCAAAMADVAAGLARAVLRAQAHHLLLHLLLQDCARKPIIYYCISYRKTARASPSPATPII